MIKSFKVECFDSKPIPTTTEDGIPIRKIFVSNLPLNVDRKELFRVFTQFGLIKNFWLKQFEKKFGKSQHGYAFITYFNPEDAHRALAAPYHTKYVQGRQVRTSAADSWHQPIMESDSVGVDLLHNKHPSNCALHKKHQDNEQQCSSKSRNPPRSNQCTCGAPKTEDKEHVQNEENNPSDSFPSMRDILNRDCLMHILSYLSLKDLIASERVSKSWLDLVKDYYSYQKLYKTSWWPDHQITMTTAVLRQILVRIGPYVQRLHIDHSWISLNDRTAHSIGKFCPNLEEFKVVNMATSNWSPVVYGCKNLKKIHFVFCRKIADANLLQLLKSHSSVKMVKITGNTHITGFFINAPNPKRFTSIKLSSCPSLQSTVINVALQKLVNLTSLKLDDCPKVWHIIPSVLEKLPKLTKLSLQDYLDSETYSRTTNDTMTKFRNAFKNLEHLQILKFRKNIFINDDILEEVTKHCHQLEYINLTCCNGIHPKNQGVTDKGVMALLECPLISRLDLSHTVTVTDEGIRACGRLPRLSQLVLRGNENITTEGVLRCVRMCHTLQNLNLSGCCKIDESLIAGAEKVLDVKPRALFIRAGGTLISEKSQSQPDEESAIFSCYAKTNQKLLTVHLEEDFAKSDWRYECQSPYYDSAEELDLDQLHEILNENPDMAELFFDNDNHYSSDDSDCDDFFVDMYFDDRLLHF